jgi:pimeloyl-ACP methyl ester carboxylesterase
MISLPYLDHGHGAPVLFVHGSNVDCRIWADHAAIIGARYRLVAPTQRYFGSLPWADDGRHFSIQTHASDLAEFIEALHLAPVTMVGWSYGGAVCLAMSLQHPEIVERLFLYEPALATFVSDPSAAKNAMDDRFEMTRAAKLEADRGDVETALQLFMNGVNDNPEAFRSLRPGVRQIMLENARMLPLLFAASPPQITCADLGRLSLPVTVALGEKSRPFYRISAEWAARCIPAARLITIPDARHLLPVEKPSEFSQVVLNFLGTVSP